MAKENRDWGYDRIVGALANLGYEVCDQTVGNVLQRHGLPTAPERKRTTTWPAIWPAFAGDNARKYCLAGFGVGRVTGTDIGTVSRRR
jgi:hypothetical protein